MHVLYNTCFVQIEADLTELKRKLDQTEGGKSALQGQVGDFTSILLSLNSQKHLERFCFETFSFSGLDLKDLQALIV